MAKRKKKSDYRQKVNKVMTASMLVSQVLHIGNPFYAAAMGHPARVQPPLSSSPAAGASTVASPAPRLAQAEKAYAAAESVQAAVYPSVSASVYGKPDQPLMRARSLRAADTEAPYMVTKGPQGPQIALRPQFEIQFNEPIVIGQGGIQFYRQHNDSLAQELRASGGTLHGGDFRISGSSLLFTPYATFEDDTVYYVTITSGTFADVTGNPFQGYLVPWSWGFRTVEVSGPRVGYWMPSLNGGDVTERPRFTLGFRDEVRPATGDIRIHRKDDGAVVQSAYLSGGVLQTPDAYYYDDANSQTANFGWFQDLPSGTSYYVEITPGTFTDMSGQAFAGLTSASDWEFRTGLYGPKLLEYGPFNRTVPLKPELTMRFSEQVRFGTGDMVIRRQQDNSVERVLHVSGGTLTGGTYRVSGNSILVKPSLALSENTAYYVDIASGTFLDADDIAFGGYNGVWSWQFRTNEDSAPEAAYLSPAQDAVESPFQLDYVIRFNEEVQIGTGDIRIHRQSDGAVVKSLRLSGGVPQTPGAYVYNDAYNYRAMFGWNDNLQSGSAYYVEITPGTFTDLSGNDFAGFSSPNEWAFRTINYNPWMEEYGPRNGRTVKAKPELTLRFNEAVHFGAGDIIIRKKQDGRVEQTLHLSGSSLTGGTYRVSGNSILVTPAAALTDGTSYYVDITSGTFLDLTGNRFERFEGEYRWEFRIVDESGPRANYWSPTVSGGEVSEQTAFKIGFSEPVQLGTGDIRVHRQSDGAIVQSARVSGGVLQETGAFLRNDKVTHVAEFGWYQNLNSGTAYYVEVTPGTFSDLSGNPFEGVTTPSAWQFKTVDYKPQLVAYAPDARVVPVKPGLQLRFSEPVRLGSGDIVIRKQDGGSAERTLHASDGMLTGGTYQISGGTVLIDLAAPLTDKTSYYVDIASGTFIDATGNGFGGFNGEHRWGFRTVDGSGPRANEWSPTVNGGDQSAHIVFTIGFDEEVRPAAGDIRIHRKSDGEIVQSARLSGGILQTPSVYLDHNASDHTATFGWYAEFGSGTAYYVEITPGTFVDLSGNPFAGFSSPSTWEFRTADYKPYLLEAGPYNRAVTAKPELTMRFSEPVHFGKGDITIRKKQDGSVEQILRASGGSLIGGTYRVSGSSMLVTPIHALPDKTEYYVDIASGTFLDSAGNGFAGFNGTWSWHFRILDETAPVAEYWWPSVSGASDINSDFTLRFNEAVRPGTGDIHIHRQSDGVVVESLRVSGGVVQTPNAYFYTNGEPRIINFGWYQDHLNSGTAYYVEVAPGTFSDLSGNAFAGVTSPSEWVFRTKDYIPRLEEYNPRDGQTAAVRPELALRFNEKVQLGTGDIIIRRQQDGSMEQTLHLSGGALTGGTYRLSGNSILVIPAKALTDGTYYYVDITSGSFVDLTGNRFERFDGERWWVFRTEDESGPRAEYWTPNLSGGESHTSTHFMLRFDEEVRPGTGDIRIHRQSDGAVVREAHLSGGVMQTPGADVYTNGEPRSVSFFWQGEDLNSGTAYYVEITPGTFADLSGNVFAGIASPNEWVFRTKDYNPWLEEYNPSQGRTAAVRPELALRFNEKVQLGTGDIVIRKQKDGSMEQALHLSGGALTGGTYRVSGNSILVTPTQTLSDGTYYYVDITSGTFVDLTGNRFERFDGEYRWVFRTADESGPRAEYWWPNVSGAGSEVRPDFTVRFDEEVRLGTGDIRIHRQSDGAVVESAHLSGGMLQTPDVYFYNNGEPRSVSFRWQSNLNSGTAYYVEIAPGTFTDLSGNAFTGIASPSEWIFRTKDYKPFFEEYGPNGGPVSIKPELRMRFNEQVRFGTGDIVIRKQQDRSVEQVLHASGGTLIGGTYRLSGNSILVTPDKTLADHTAYYIDITSGTFLDMTGNGFERFDGDYRWRFLTADETGPTANYWWPNASGQDYALSPEFTLRFNENVQLGLGDIRIHRQSDGAVVREAHISGGALYGSDAYLNYSPTNLTASFGWYGALNSGTAYYVEITPGTFADTAGNAYNGIGTSSRWEFKTYDNAPWLRYAAPTGSGASVFPELTMQFSEPVQMGLGDIVIRYAQDGSIAQQLHTSGGTLTGGVFRTSGTTMLITPTAALKPDTSYYVDITSGAFVDLNGTRFSGAFGTSSWNFRTAKSKSEVEQPKPPVTSEETSSGSASTGTQPAAKPDEAVVPQQGAVDLSKDASVTREVGKDGQSLSKMTLGAGKLQQALTAAQPSGSQDQQRQIVIQAAPGETSVQVDFPAGDITDAIKKGGQGLIAVKAGDVSIRVPLGVLEQLASNVKAEESISISVIRVTEAAAEKVSRRAAAEGITPLTAPVEFTIKAGNRELTDFRGTYVERSVALEHRVDASKITAVWVDPANGRMHFVPAVVTTSGTGSEVTVKSPHNSTYMLAVSERSFNDIQGHWAQQDIELMARKLVVDGATDTEFKPQQPVTRAQFTAMVVRALGLSEAETPAILRDVKTGDWYAGAVGAAVRAGLVHGYEDGTFRADQPVTREQMSTIIHEAKQYASGERASAEAGQALRFKDAAEISAWASAGVAANVSSGLIDGLSKDSFGPKATADRAQAATMMKRLLQFLKFIN